MTAGKSVPTVELFGVSIMGLFSSLFLSTCVGSVGTFISTFILLGLDFVINVYATYSIWRKYRAGQFQECGEKLKGLVVTEFNAIFVPFSYLLCFLVVYYGPNAEVIGKFTLYRRRYICRDFFV
jgi:hypothetical protein